MIGAGLIGCEMAQSFARFGSEVSLFEAKHGILQNDDRDAAEIVQQALVRDGVKLYCCGKNLNITRQDDGTKVLSVDSHDGHVEVQADAVLVGVGRKANVEGLGLESVGVECTSAGVTVDDMLRTTNKRIFAAGDVCSKFKFTHTADFQARIVIQNALFGFVPLGKAKGGRLVVPWCTYTSPELAHVGMSPADAKDKGVEIDERVLTFDDVHRAVLDGETEGLLKVYTLKGKDKIVGATLVASHAGDLISELTLAITQGIGLSKIAGVIHPYPTQAEVIRKAGDAYNRTRLTPLAKKVFARIMAWQR